MLFRSAKQATRGRRGRSRGRGRPDNRQPDGRAATGRPLFCEFHGEGSHTTSECRTIPAMMHYMGQNRPQPQRNDGGGAGNQPCTGNQPRAGNQLPADWHKYAVEMGVLLEQFQRQRALPGDHHRA